MKEPDQGTSEASLPDADAGTTPKYIKRIPKGMSEYQAAWIFDSDEEDDEGDLEDAGSDMASMEAESHEEAEAPEEEEAEASEEEEMAVDELIELESKKSVVAFRDLDVEEEAQQCVFCQTSSPVAVWAYPLLETREMAGPQARGRRRRAVP